MILKKKDKNSAYDLRALAFALKSKTEECEALAEENAAIKSASEKVRRERERSVSDAASLESAERARYMLALNSLYIFTDKIDRLAASNATVAEKKAITDVLRGFWNGSEELSAMKTAVKKVTDALADDGEEDDDFDISAALNAEGLDLKKLCEEFGVYQG